MEGLRLESAASTANGDSRNIQQIRRVAQTTSGHADLEGW